ncbi:hypothetical protein HNP38_001006 [Chryseobacterium defluvii]|uniref:Uncharacterized protein n=1 Tax=Chryseobacterium defluvii TaxID=160396 RepID=A0A840KD81_9FLAO|nr:hypothetical protein [Chryseobacterium defluvii]MBB4805734.1 hypothetical protein [Chryseobacterium defluvii]
MAVSTSQIEMIPVSSIAMVKVIKGTFPAGMGSLNGAIAIYTRHGNMAPEIKSQDKLSGLKQYTFKGYDKEIPFNNSVYINPDFKNIPKDSRSTLYWNPYLETQPNEPATIQFYNNDDAKNYKVIIMGFDRSNDIPVYYDEILE